MYKVDRILGLDDIDSELLNKAQSIKIAVFGLGGLGCPALLYLVSGGYKNFTLVDFDTIDESNLARQILYKLDDIGKYKAEVADREVKKINPAMHNHVVINRASDEEVARIVNSNDIILDCTDNFDARLKISRFAKHSNKVLISGAVIRYEGQVTVFKNRLMDPCYECLYGVNNNPLENCVGSGVFSPLAGVIGSYMACETMKMALFDDSQLVNQLHIFDLKQNLWVKAEIKRNSKCTACN
jgi:molybdopterin-synthase adenylyltransferase